MNHLTKHLIVLTYVKCNSYHALIIFVRNMTMQLQPISFKNVTVLCITMSTTKLMYFMKNKRNTWHVVRPVVDIDVTDADHAPQVHPPRRCFFKVF